MDLFYESKYNFGIETSIGDKGYNMSYFHYHNEYELFILDDGSRSIIIGDTIVNLSKFDVGLIPANTFHRTAGTYFSRTILYFSSQFLEEYFSPKAIETLISCFQIPTLRLAPDEYIYVKKKIQHMQKEDIRDPQNKIYLLLGDVLALLSKKSSTPQSYTPSALETDTLIAQALNYINQHYKTIQSLDEIASHLFITKYHLCRIFKQATSMTVNQYLMSLRMKYARELLISTNKSAAQIAAECGFSSPIYFAQYFKKQFSMTPLSYRAQEKQKESETN